MKKITSYFLSIYNKESVIIQRKAGMLFTVIAIIIMMDIFSLPLYFFGIINCPFL
ncbi:MAG: hypothetical protein JW881_06910 [Spirochaetales bacterium]|nr:hypothetical protein [Spirochaetales bacterium]